MNRGTLLIGFLLLTQVLFGQVERTSDLYRVLKAKDSLLFEVGFNTCDISQFEKLVSNNFEFYHDQGGITATKEAFINSIKTGICQADYKPSRKLLDATMEVFPLLKNGVLYGAIQNGNHQFYAKYANKPQYLSATAKFTHVWLLEEGQWKLSRGLSYDHQDQPEPINETLLFNDKAETERWLKQKHIPALGIGFIENGKIRQVSVFGELEKGKPAPLNTIWNVASLTKPITALVTLKLIDSGKLGLDEPLYKYVDDPDIAQDPRRQKLTPRIILSHQTGFPNWRSDVPDGKLTFEFEPGTQYQYSGEGFEYLRKALEKKFNKTLEKLAAELIFNPLKMNDTQFAWDEKTDENRFAKWHTKEGELYETEKNKRANGADNLLTTVADYSKFMLYVLNGAGLSKQLYSEMIRAQVRVNEVKSFGLGWCIDENINENKDFAVVHGGDDIGVHTIVFILPKSKKGLLIFTNSDNGTDAFIPILLKYLGKEGQGIIDVEMK